MIDVGQEKFERIKIIVFFVLLATLVPLGIRSLVLQLRRDRQRTDGMKDVAQKLGLTFEGSYAALNSRFGNFAAFTSPYGNVGSNLMTGVVAGHTVTVMDDIIPGRKSTGERSWTLAFFPDGARDLPDFELSSVAMPKMLKGLVHDRIDLPNQAEFAKHYTLTGKDGDAVRRVFTDSVVSFLVADPSWRVQTLNGAVTVTRNAQLLAPAQIPDFLTRAVQLLEQLRRH